MRIALFMLAFSTTSAFGQLPFRKINLHTLFVGEGVTVGNFNKDNYLDVGVRDFWHENPKGGTGVWMKATMVKYAGLESNIL